MLAAQIIKKKRDGHSLTASEIKNFLDGFLANEIADYQMSAFLMAVYFRGMNEEETAILTEVMLKSGEQVSFIPTQRWKFFVDKHSTGGVGDKTSLILAPVVASLGYAVPMISGRGLGHTGGTLDKLESIPGFRTQLTLKEFQHQVNEIGCALIGQTPDLCPADKRLYALRDVTATVESIPLICASIMSKKLAEGIQGLVLDVKFGSGAFMKELSSAKKLAQGLLTIAKAFNKQATALLTSMEQPLGSYAGNSLEIKECIEILTGSEQHIDTRDLSLELAAQMVALAGVPIDQAKAECQKALSSGQAWKKFQEICAAQGGQLDKLPLPTQKWEVCAIQEGYIHRMNVENIGWINVELGAGRRKVTDPIDPACGLQFHKKIGDRVQKGEPIFTLWGTSSELLKKLSEPLTKTVEIRPEKSQPINLIGEILKL